MNDELPIIFVDDRRLSPIRRISKASPASDAASDRQKPPFGIVDRVTISPEARLAYRQTQSLAVDPSHPLQLPARRHRSIAYDTSARLTKDPV